MKEVIIKDTQGFQLRVKKWECAVPKGLYAVHFTQATKNTEGKIDMESTYEFFLDQNDLDKVAEALTS